jgi:hypothetical protein
MDFPPHIEEMGKAAFAERQKYSIGYSDTHGAWQVVSVDPLRNVLFQGSWENCEIWLGCKALEAAMASK